MFKTIKNYLKSKEYITLEHYSKDGCDIQINVDDEGVKMARLRDHENNRLIEITQNKSYVKHEINDGLRGITTVFEVPLDVYKKILK